MERGELRYRGRVCLGHMCKTNGLLGDRKASKSLKKIGSEAVQVSVKL